MKGRAVLLFAASIAGIVAIAGSARKRVMAPPAAPTAAAPNSPPATTVAAVALGEVDRWKGLTEASPAADAILRDYWAATGQPYPGPSTAWSAAFISWVVAHSNVPNALAPSGGHVYYARQAYLDRGKPGRFGAFRLDEVSSIEPGDIVVSSRAADAGAVPLIFADLQQPGPFVAAHGDVVVAANGSMLHLVGGNVDDGVTERAASATSPNLVAVLRYQPKGVA